MPKQAPTEQTTEADSRWGWFLAGAVVGVAIGVLYAPSSGRSAREAIAGAGREWYGRSREFYLRGKGLMDDAAELFERGRRLATRDLD